MALKNQMARSAALGVAMLIGVGLCAPQAQAAYVVTVEQVGSGVVATGAGSIDFSALIFYGAGGDSAGLSASDGVVAVGPTIDTPDTYYAGIAGPVATFGTGGPFDASSGAGAIVGLGTFGQIGGGVVAVPQGYAPGTPLGTSTDAWAARPSAASA